MVTRVVNIHHGAPYDVYVGRAGKGKPGPFGNPIRINARCFVCGNKHGRDPHLLGCYGWWLDGKLASDPGFRARVRALAGKTLGCFCLRPDGSGLCHGTILADRADKLATAATAAPECEWCGRRHAHRRERIACATEQSQADRQPIPASTRPVRPELPRAACGVPFLAGRPTITLIVDGPFGRARATYHRSATGAQCPDPPPDLAWLPAAGDPTPALRERGASFFWVA